MTDPSEPAPEPANLRFLRRLVTTLTAVMILGLLVIVSLLVIRFWTEKPPVMPLPDQITLPEGKRAISVTYGPGYFVVVTEDDRILVFDAVSGDITQTIPFKR
ncbi:DUF6476 family protein [Sedimentitalea arenosa]|uniref:Uncharacterized protein n=1 Tax=Sedimentitalea arenosa TaxID=2798803 RepID=A0A8J7LV54_9RHOB|nr:DUF6476 family protein [Arenibacterium arenosum]MBJ6370590.1 hypothetical protein [Arenibacterium arenosum]